MTEFNDAIIQSFYESCVRNVHAALHAVILPLLTVDCYQSNVLGIAVLERLVEDPGIHNTCYEKLIFLDSCLISEGEGYKLLSNTLPALLQKYHFKTYDVIFLSLLVINI